MANKKNCLGMLAMALAFGFTVSGCASKPPLRSADGLFEYQLTGIGSPKLVKICDYLGTDTDVVIPEQIDGNAVQIIGKPGFAVRGTAQEGFAGVFEGKSLTSVVFPAGIKFIEAKAFANNKLTNVTLPGGIAVYQSAFAGNPIASYTLGKDIICGSSDSLTGLTPYYYGNGKQPGVYALNGGGWECNGSPLELPAILKMEEGKDLSLAALDGKTFTYAGADTIEYRMLVYDKSANNNKGGNRDDGYWIPAGKHSLKIAKTASGSSGIGTGGSGPSFELQEDFQAGVIYLITENKKENTLECKAQGPWVPPQE
jgi:hypothetical protein